jgi:hypothetical protein
MSQNRNASSDGNHMRKGHSNHRLVKIHRNYTTGEVADVLSNHKNTVRAWIKAGLPTIADKRPTLILGDELIAFLRARRAKNKKTCRAGEIYCVRCRAPKLPAGDIAEYQPITEKFGNLTAICPDCASIMNRCVSMAKLGQVRGKMDIAFPQALRRLSESNQPTVNSDLEQETVKR